MSGRTIVEYFSENEKYKCGYCGSKDTNYSHGMWAHSMTVQDYQDLIDRGWRRSGAYVYKPTLKQTCCPQYPIKCNTLEFKLSHSQKKVIKRVNRFLNTGIKPGGKDSELPDGGTVATEARVRECIPDESRIKASDVGTDVDMSRVTGNQTVIDELQSEGVNSESNPAPVTDVKTKVIKSDCDAATKKTTRPGQLGSATKGEGADLSKPKCVKAKLRRQQAWQKKHPNAQLGQKRTPQGKSLEDHLNDLDPNPVHKLELRLVRSQPKSAAFEETFSESHTVYKTYQMAIHHDAPDKPSASQYTRFLCKSPLQVRLVRRKHPESREFEASFSESHGVYRKYQMDVHKDELEECDIQGYTRFLVDSPLQAESHEGGFPDGFGSFHQQYLLDGKLIAVGVIDILPHCISSVYLYYDPEYHFLSLGTYSALREVAFTRHIHTMEPDLKFYYMGFYIHSCPKMRYKGHYQPSFLVCPETYAWFPIEECRPKLDVNKYSRFAPPDQVDPESTLSLDSFMVLFARQAMPYRMYRVLNQEADDEATVRQYGGFVGNKLAKRMLLYRS